MAAETKYSAIFTFETSVSTEETPDTITKTFSGVKSDLTDETLKSVGQTFVDNALFAKGAAVITKISKIVKRTQTDTEVALA